MVFIVSGDPYPSKDTFFSFLTFPPMNIVSLVNRVNLVNLVIEAHWCNFYRTRLLVLSRSLRYDIHCTSAQVDFSTDGRELTPTMKMARHAVLKKYAAEVCTNPLLFNASLRNDEILFKLISNFTSSISRWRRCTVESSTVTAFTAAASPNDQPRESSNQTWQKIIAQNMDIGKEMPQKFCQK